MESRLRYKSIRPALLVLLAVFLMLPAIAQKQETPMKREESLIKLSKQGNVRAQLQLGISYLTGKNDIRPNAKKAWKWLREAAKPRKESGRDVRNPRALLYLGICYDEYFQFLKLEPDKQKALEYYLLAIENGLPDGHHYAAFTYMELAAQAEENKDKESMATSLARAAEHFKEAADFGNQICQVEYGKILLTGRGVKADPKGALPYLMKAAKQGSGTAQLLLADCYGGAHPPIKADARKMVEYLWAASTKEAEAMTRIGYCYERGIGFQQNQLSAVKWYQRAAAAGDPRALINLGSCYAGGRGVRKDERLALEYYLKATKAVRAPAISYYNVATCYALGKGAAANDEYATFYFRKAAKRNLAQAMYRLGLLHEEGRIMEKGNQQQPKDLKKALAWFEKATKQDHPAAWYKVGQAYYYGHGAEKDQEKARKAYLKAASLGSSSAEEAVRTLFK